MKHKLILSLIFCALIQSRLAWTQPNTVENDATGAAKYALSLYTGEARFLGIEKLFSIDSPLSISDEVKKQWREKVPANDFIWREAQIKWTNDWASVFSPSVGNNVQAWQTHDLKEEAQFKTAQDLALKLPPDSNERAWVEWQMATGRGIKSQTKLAVAHLQALLDSKQTLISEDEVLMAMARIMFQDKKFNSAIHFYDSISKGSDLWLESIEEKAWSYLRQNDYEKALGQFHTLMTPAFAPQVGPEPYFMGSFADLKICDYNSIFKILKDFRAKYRGVLPELEKLAKTGVSPYVTQALPKLEKRQASWASLGSDVDKLPRLFNRDMVLLKAIDRQKNYLNELGVLNSLDSSATNIKILAQQRVEEAHQLIINRTKQLARADLNGLSKILQKLHIIEIEAIQRMGTDQKTAKKTSLKSGVTKREVLTFPKENEIWLDEVTHYEVSSKGCPTKGGHTP